MSKESEQNKGRKLTPEQDREGNLMEAKSRLDKKAEGPGSRKASDRKDDRRDKGQRKK